MKQWLHERGLSCFVVFAVIISGVTTLWGDSAAIQFTGRGGVGALLYSGSVEVTPAPYGDVSIEMLCLRGAFCHRFRPRFASMEVQFAINDDHLVSSFVPYIQGGFRAVQISYAPWLRFGAGSVTLGRNPRYLDTVVNLSVQSIEIQLERKRPISVGNYSLLLTMQALGGKYLEHRTASLPFKGLAVLGVVPEFRVEALKSQTSWETGVKLGLQISVGKSGDQVPDMPGSFGAWLLEPYADIHTRLQVQLKQTAASHIDWYMQLSFRYHAILDTGSRSLDMGFFAMAHSGIIF